MCGEFCFLIVVFWGGVGMILIVLIWFVFVDDYVIVEVVFCVVFVDVVVVEFVGFVLIVYDLFEDGIDVELVVFDLCFVDGLLLISNVFVLCE